MTFKTEFQKIFSQVSHTYRNRIRYEGENETLGQITFNGLTEKPCLCVLALVMVIDSLSTG